jgi:transcriptional regulator with XRE-family HTH domain
MNVPVRPLSRARSIRKEGEAQGWNSQQIADAIVSECGVTTLRAHRLARNWTLAELADQIRAQSGAAGEDLSKIAHQRISRWETGHESPTPRYLEALCRVFETRPDLLGFGHDYGTPVSSADNSVTASAGVLSARSETGSQALVYPSGDGESADEMKRRQLLLSALGAAGGLLSKPVLDAVQGARRDMESSLSAATTSISMLDAWEERIEEYGFAFRYTTPVRLLCSLVVDLGEVRQLAARRQPLDIQRRLYHITSQLMGVGALALGDAGHSNEANSWMRDSLAVADETGDRRLRAWVLAKSATELLFHGASPELAIARARRAQIVAGNSPSSGLAIAYSAEARAYAVLGDKLAMEKAFGHAKDQFSRLRDNDTTSSVHAYSERQMRFHEGDALTAVGDTRKAMAAHQLAATLYPATEPLEPALIRINESKCLVKDGDVTAACQHAISVLEGLPVEYRSTVAIARASEVIELIPARLRSRGEARALTELLASYSTA